MLPPRAGIDSSKVYTNDNVMRLDELPARMVVIGGGVDGRIPPRFLRPRYRSNPAGTALPPAARVDAEVVARFEEAAKGQWNIVKEAPPKSRVNADGSV